MKIDDSIMKSRKKLHNYLMREGLPFGINKAFEVMAKPKKVKKGTNPDSVEFDFQYGVGKSMTGHLRVEKDSGKFNIVGKRSEFVERFLYRRLAFLVLNSRECRSGQTGQA